MSDVGRALLRAVTATTPRTLAPLLVCAVTASVAASNGVARAAPSVAAAEADCTGDTRIDERFANGARWELCVASRVRENLVLRHLTYTAPGAEPLVVLAAASLAQLHVAYDDDAVRYNDVTQYGLGGGYLIELIEADCPDGTLLELQTRPVLCRQRRTGGDAYRSARRAVESERLTLFSVSQVGAYAYVQRWTLHDDGAVQPAIGATGALQRSSLNLDEPYGRVLAGDDDALWLSHTHDYHWRLDFDVGARADDDVVTETRFVPAGDGRRVRERERLTAESARRVEPALGQSWHVWEGLDADGAPGPRGFRIEPSRHGHRYERTGAEPHTGFDLFVTVARDCERYASQNALYEPDCADDVLGFADDAEPLDGADLVLWHRVGFHHVPRNEDQRHMHAHWDGFVIEPVDVHAGNPAVEARGNTPPVLVELGSREGALGERVATRLEARDADGDALSWSAENLPPGIAIDPDGELVGRFDESGEWRVRVRVDDGRSVVSGGFVWQVSVPPQARASGRGAFPAWLLVMLGATLLGRGAHRILGLRRAERAD